MAEINQSFETIIDNIISEYPESEWVDQAIKQIPDEEPSIIVEYISILSGGDSIDID